MIVEDLQSLGFASVLVDEAAVGVVTRAFAALHGFMHNVSAQDKARFFRYFDGGRVGA